MENQELIEKSLEWVEEGKDFDEIKKRIDAHLLPEEDRRVVLEAVDQMFVHLELHQQNQQKGIGQMIIGGILLTFPLLIAFLTYDPSSKITYLWFAGALWGAWMLKEGYKKTRQPFDPPRQAIYKREKFRRF